MNWHLDLASADFFLLDALYMKGRMLSVYFINLAFYSLVFAANYPDRVTLDYPYGLFLILFAQRIFKHSANHLISLMLWKMDELWIKACHHIHLYYHACQVSYPWPFF